MNEGYQLLAQSLSAEQRRALQIVKGSLQIERAKIDEGAFVVLRELALIREVRAASDEEREFLELTQRGRHVGEFI